MSKFTKYFNTTTIVSVLAALMAWEVLGPTLSGVTAKIRGFLPSL